MLESLQRSGFSKAEFVLFGRMKSAMADLDVFSKALLSPDDGQEYAELLAQRLATGQDPEERGLVVVIENLEEWTGSIADDPLQRLVRACRAEGHFVIIEGEVSSFAGSYGLPGVVKSDRHGIVLQPDQVNGDQVLGTEFPRVKRADFPQGRGLYVKSGRVMRVQIPVAEASVFNE